MSKKNKGGRPPAFRSESEMVEKCEAFVERIRTDTDFVPTMHGLASELGICRDTLHEYRKKPEFSDILKRAMTASAAWWEKRLAENACTGAIFWLKNHGWADKTQTELSGGLNMRDLSGPELKQRIADMLKNEDLLASLGLSKTEVGSALSAMAGQLGKLNHPI
jgi:hypothetical protein